MDYPRIVESKKYGPFLQVAHKYLSQPPARSFPVSLLCPQQKQTRLLGSSYSGVFILWALSHMRTGCGLSSIPCTSIETYVHEQKGKEEMPRITCLIFCNQAVFPPSPGGLMMTFTEEKKSLNSYILGERRYLSLCFLCPRCSLPALAGFSRFHGLPRFRSANYRLKLAVAFRHGCAQRCVYLKIRT